MIASAWKFIFWPSVLHSIIFQVCLTLEIEYQRDLDWSLLQLLITLTHVVYLPARDKNNQLKYYWKCCLLSVPNMWKYCSQILSILCGFAFLISFKANKQSRHLVLLDLSVYCPNEFAHLLVYQTQKNKGIYSRVLLLEDGNRFTC